MTSFLKSENCNHIIEQILFRLTSVSSTSRRILNVLNLIEFLLKNGSSKFKGEIEDERFYLNKMKENFNDEYDMLHKPIQNIITKIVDLLKDYDKLQQEREEAKKIRERIKGVSNETPVFGEQQSYQGYSSDDLNKNSYDIQPEINLKKKLGFEVESKNDQEEKIKQNIQDHKEDKNQSQNDQVDFLGEISAEEKPVEKLKEAQKPKKKVFLPPPPKKGKNQHKVYHKKKSVQKEALQNDNDIFNFETKQNPDNVQDQDVNLLDIDLLNAKESPKKNNLNNINLDDQPKNDKKQQQDDLLDLTEFNLKQDKKENSIDNYLNFLSNTNSNKLPQPPRKIKTSDDDKYNFF